MLTPVPLHFQSDRAVASTPRNPPATSASVEDLVASVDTYLANNPGKTLIDAAENHVSERTESGKANRAYQSLAGLYTRAKQGMWPKR